MIKDVNTIIANKSSAPLDCIPCIQLKGVGRVLAETLARCGIHTIQDLLFHLPLRYQDRTRITPKANLFPGKRLTVFGEVRGFGHNLSMIHPEYRQVQENIAPSALPHLTPVY